MMQFECFCLASEKRGCRGCADNLYILFIQTLRRSLTCMPTTSTKSVKFLDLYIIADAPMRQYDGQKDGQLVEQISKNSVHFMIKACIFYDIYKPYCSF